MSKYPCKYCIVISTCKEPCDKAEDIIQSQDGCMYCGNETTVPNDVLHPLRLTSCTRCNSLEKSFATSWTYTSSRMTEIKGK